MNTNERETKSVGEQDETCKPAGSHRIAYVLKRFPHLSQTFILNEMLELERQGASLEIFAVFRPRTSVQHAGLSKLNARVTYLTESDTAAEVSIASVAQTLEQLLHERKIGHMHAHFASYAASLAMRASEQTGIPYSFTAHARDIFHRKVEASALAKKLSTARFVVTVSDFNKNYLDDLLRRSGSLSGRILRLYNGIDLVQLRPGAYATREPGLIVSVGRLVQKKGFTYLVEACRILQEQGVDFRCLIAGDGEEHDRLQELIIEQELTERVSLLGALPQDAVLQLMARGGMFVLPCIVGDDGDQDGLPTVLLEAMALGTPVISTRIAGVPEMIANEETGLLVEQKDAAALASAIKGLISMPELRSRFSEAALADMHNRFDLSKNVSMLKQWFMDSVQGNAIRSNER